MSKRLTPVLNLHLKTWQNLDLHLAHSETWEMELFWNYSRHPFQHQWIQTPPPADSQMSMCMSQFFSAF